MEGGSADRESKNSFIDWVGVTVDEAEGLLPINKSPQIGLAGFRRARHLGEVRGGEML
jgi:hypothetical protein